MNKHLYNDSHPHRTLSKWGLLFGVASACLLAEPSRAATRTILAEDFESYSDPATSIDDVSNANPANSWFNVTDDSPAGGVTASGVQLVDWLSHGGTQSLLFRSGTTMQVNMPEARSGSSYEFDFWVYASKEATSDRNFRIVLQGQGADYNGSDFLAYRVRNVAGSTQFEYYDGVGPGAGAWVPFEGYQILDAWQHHRLVIDPNAMTFDLYLDTASFEITGFGKTTAGFEISWQPAGGAKYRVQRTTDLKVPMVDITEDLTTTSFTDTNVPGGAYYRVVAITTPVLTGAELARPEVAVPTRLIIQNEGNSADDGYFAIDDIRVTAENAVNLATVITEGFESYPARTSPEDDADPMGPWITTETDGTGTGRVRAPVKVQVVNSDVVTPRSGTQCLKLEYGQRAGVSLAWGVPAQADVQITWWARVPASAVGGEYTLLRMSLYGVEGGSTYANDTALLGYGTRNTTVGDSTSLTYYTTTWVDSEFDFTPDTWEEYRLTTHNSVGQYTIIKGPSSSNPQVIVDRKPFIGTTASWGPTFMAAWSSSNGTNHPPVYIDDIEIKTLVSNPDPLPTPYTVQIEGTRFTKATILPLIGPIGKAVVDPRDNSTIVFTVDAATGGGIYKATKTASGTWTADPTPIVGNLANPSGLAIGQDGTIWWTHDFTAALMRLKAPWESNTPEQVITDFIMPGATVALPQDRLDDDPFDVCFPPSDFNGTRANSSSLVLMDRGVDGANNANDALFIVDPTTTQLEQVNYEQYLFGPTTDGFGSGDLVAITALQSAEVATLCVDGQVTLVNANGNSRTFWPDFYADPFVDIEPSAMAADPVTGRLWVADDLLNEVWSCTSDGVSGLREISFPLTNTERPELQINFAEPGMSFAPNGSFLVLSDSSTLNGGGRLIILHNEP